MPRAAHKTTPRLSHLLSCEHDWAAVGRTDDSEVSLRPRAGQRFQQNNQLRRTAKRRSQSGDSRTTPRTTASSCLNQSHANQNWVTGNAYLRLVLARVTSSCVTTLASKGRCPPSYTVSSASPDAAHDPRPLNLDRLKNGHITRNNTLRFLKISSILR